MSQCTEFSILCNKSQSSDSLGIIPYPDAELVFARRILHRRERHRNQAVFPSDTHRNRAAVQILQIVDQVLLAGYFLLVQGNNIVTRLQKIFRRILNLSVAGKNFPGVDHQHARGFHVNSHAAPADQNAVRLRGCHFDILKMYFPQKRAGQLIASFSRHRNGIPERNKRDPGKTGKIQSRISVNVDFIRNFPVQITIAEKYHCKKIQDQTKQDKMSVFSFLVHVCHILFFCLSDQMKLGSKGLLSLT